MFTPIIAWLSAHSAVIFSAAMILAVGWVTALLLQRVLRRAMAAPFGQSTAIITGKVVRNLVMALTLFSALSACGIKLNGILAAAGVMGVAIGFAAQTSLSNLISGIFLIGENAFRIGEVVTIDGTTGTVYNIGLLATQVRTFDNRLVRYPNEMLVKQPIINVTRFPIRRLDIPVGAAYKEDPARVIATLKEIANANPLALDEPKPVVIFNGFGASSMDFTLGVWFVASDLLALRTSILCDIKTRFDSENIEIPFPHLSIYTGSETKPFPITPPVQPAAPISESHS